MKIKESEIEFMTDIKNLRELTNDFHEKLTPLTAKVINDGYVLPVKPAPSFKWGIGGVLDSHKNFVIESMHPGFAKDRESRFGSKYEFDSSNVRFIDEDVIYIDPIIQQWGHFLVDSISRLWYALKYTDYKIVFCGYGFEKNTLASPYIDFFGLLGIDNNRIIDVREPLRFKSIHVPEMSYIADRYYTKEFIKLFEVARSNINYDSCLKKLGKLSKVYLTRTHYKGNGIRYREVGESDLERIYKSNGYKIFAPEELTLEEQIYVFSQSQEIVSLSGTIAHNVLFSDYSTRFVILNKTSHIQRQQYYLNYLNNIDNINIDVFWEPLRKFNIPKDTGSGPFLLGVTDNFREYCSKNDIVFNDSKILIRSRWYLKFIWLIFIFPIRKIRIFYLKGISKLLKIKSNLFRGTWRENDL